MRYFDAVEIKMQQLYMKSYGSVYIGKYLSLEYCFGQIFILFLENNYKLPTLCLNFREFDLSLCAMNEENEFMRK